jgi:hypothetical protein
MMVDSLGIFFVLTPTHKSRNRLRNCLLHHKQNMCFYCHVLGNHPLALPHRGRNCIDPKNTHSKFYASSPTSQSAAALGAAAAAAPAAARPEGGPTLNMLHTDPQFPRWLAKVGLTNFETETDAASRDRNNQVLQQLYRDLQGPTQFLNLIAILNEPDKPNDSQAERRRSFFEGAYPVMRDLLRRSADLFPTAIPILQRQRPGCVDLSREQIACLLSGILLNLWGGVPQDRRLDLPSTSVTTFLTSTWPCDMAKTRMVLSYFFHLGPHGLPEGTVSFQRCVMDKGAQAECNVPEVCIFSTISTGASPCL